MGKTGDFAYVQFIPIGIELPQTVIQVMEQLEQNEWLPRGRFSEMSIRFWPEYGRSKQICIDLRYPMNDHKIAFLSKQTGIQFEIEEETE